MTLVVAILTTTAAIGPDLEDQDRVIVGSWLNKIVKKIAANKFYQQDNKSYMSAYITMLWGLMTQDFDAVQKTIDVVKLAIHDMRPDGSFPTDSQRSGMGLHYSSMATGHLVMMSALIYSNTQQDLFSYTVKGRSIHNAVNFILNGIKNPVITNQLYATSCPGGGDRWGTVTNPSMSFSLRATYLVAYAKLFPNSPNADFINDYFPSEDLRPSRLYAATPRLLVAEANLDRNFAIQQYLVALGYDARPIDGIVGRNLNRQLNKAFFENGYDFDGIVDDAELNLLKKIAQQKKVIVSVRKLGVTRRNLEQIMDKQTASLFVASDRNTSRKDAFEIVEFRGRTAAKISVSMRDKGHDDDWGRFGTEGAAQRFQVQEKPRVYEMVDGNEYWYKFSIFIPDRTGSSHHTIAPFDIKDRKNGSQRDAALDFTITNNQITFQLKRGGEECVKIKNSAGKVTDFCERPGLIANMLRTEGFKNTWLDFVFQFNLREGEEITRFWINGDLIGVVDGDLSPQGKHLGFKFGPYRNNISKPPQDETIYYSDIMRRNSCEDLGIDKCEDFQESQTKNGVFGAKEILACFKEPSQGKPCPVICRGSECEKL